MRQRLHLWTGPVIVHAIAEACRDANLNVVAEGTEHVYLDVDAPTYHEALDLAREDLRTAHGTDFGLR